MRNGAEQQLCLEHVPCDLCGGNGQRVRYRKPDDWLWREEFEFPVVECTGCGLVYVNPRPPYKRMARYYPPGYHDHRDTADHLRRYREQAKFLPALTHEAVLDIGCARGDWLHYLKGRYPAIATYGVDAFCDSVSYSHITYFKGGLPEVGLPAAHFDLVTAWAVFEHLHAPGSYFSEVFRVLKPGGRFVFLVTNANSLYGRWAFQEDIPRHLYHFSPRTVRAYAGKYGFSVGRILFDDRIWDGRGRGTFKHIFRRLAGVDWPQLREQRYGPLAKGMIGMGKLLDAVIFSTHWEARLRCSGVMVVELVKG